jgi:hypothetical protein
MWSERSEVDERVRAEASRDQGQACSSPRQQGFQVMRVDRSSFKGTVFMRFMSFRQRFVDGWLSMEMGG